MTSPMAVYFNGCLLITLFNVRTHCYTLHNRLEWGFSSIAPLVFRRLRFLFGISPPSFTFSFGMEMCIGNLLVGNFATPLELKSSGRRFATLYVTAKPMLLYFSVWTGLFVNMIAYILPTFTNTRDTAR